MKQAEPFLSHFSAYLKTVMQPPVVTAGGVYFIAVSFSLQTKD